MSWSGTFTSTRYAPVSFQVSVPSTGIRGPGIVPSWGPSPARGRPLGRSAAGSGHRRRARDPRTAADAHARATLRLRRPQLPLEALPHRRAVAAGVPVARVLGGTTSAVNRAAWSAPLPALAAFTSVVSAPTSPISSLTTKKRPGPLFLPSVSEPEFACIACASVVGRRASTAHGIRGSGKVFTRPHVLGVAAHTHHLHHKSTTDNVIPDPDPMFRAPLHR